MFKSNRLYQSALYLITIVLLFTSVEAQKKAKETGSVGNQVLWERVNIPQQDLYHGTGGTEMRPDLSRVTFIKEEKGGYSKKYRIKDGDGNTWVAKLGREAQSETASVRLLSAIGYKTEIVYLVPRITIPGKGTFSNVRLEARPESVDRKKEWRWSKNPFTGTNELQGLKLMMAFLNNWDMKDSNNVVLQTGNELQYVISDLGVSFGKTGVSGFPLLRWIGRTRNNPRDYSKSKFISGVKNGRVKIAFNGKNYQQMKNITLPNARWLADLLTQLSDKQIRDAFRAANYSDRNINLLTSSVKDRINQLDRAAENRRLAGTK